MGLLDSDMSLLGLGLLASAGPSPMGVPQGIGQGLLMGRSLMEDARKTRSETRRAQLAEQKFAFEMEQARQAQLEAERRNAAMAQFRETLPEGMRGLFDIAPGPVATGLLGQMMPKPTDPTTLQQNLLAAGLQPGTPEFQRAMMQAVLKPQTVVQMPQSEKTISVSDAQRMRDANGNTPPIGMTFGEAAASGFRIVSPVDDKTADDARRREQAQASQSAAVQRFVEALDALKNSPDIGKGSEAMARFQTARVTLAQQMALANNPGRAPTDKDIDAEISKLPSPLSVSSVVGGMLGGDPVTESLREVIRGLNLNPDDYIKPRDSSPAASPPGRASYRDLFKE